MNRALWRHLWRRHALASALCAILPVLIGAVMGIVWPEYRLQVKAMGGLVKFVQSLLRSDLLAPDSAAFFFQIPFAHPVTMLALILSVALPTLALPAGARGRGTLDLLLATGLERRQLIVTTSLFTLPFALLLGLAPLAGAWIGASITGATAEIPFDAYARVSFEAVLLGLFFSGLAQLLSVLAEDGATAARWLAAIVLWSLFAEITGTGWPAAALLKWLTPFGYYEPAQVIAGVADYARDCAVLAGAAAVCFGAALVLESRRRSA